MKKRFGEFLILAVIISLGVWGLSSICDSQPSHQGTIRFVPGTQCSFVFAASNTTKTCTLDSTYQNSLTHSLKLVLPAFAATAPTATLSILDSAGSTIYSVAGIAENTTTYIPLERPLSTGSSFVILLTTTAGTGGGTATLDNWIWTESR